MKLLTRKVVVEYTYESEEEAEKHEKTMASDGWSVEYKKHYFAKHFRSYYKRQREGVFL